jgi:hypothetical protein
MPYFLWNHRVPCLVMFLWLLAHAADWHAGQAAEPGPPSVKQDEPVPFPYNTRYPNYTTGTASSSAWNPQFAPDPQWLGDARQLRILLDKTLLLKPPPTRLP